MIIKPYRGKEPSIDKSAYLAEGTVVIGDVSIGANASLWFSAVARGDRERVVIGEGTNIQDGSVVHVSAGNPCIIGNRVTAGHRTVMHGCKIAGHCVIGIGAVVLDGAVLGEGTIVAAGSLVPPDKKFPPRSFLMGTPAKLVREVTDEEYERYEEISTGYIQRAQEYREIFGL